MNSDSPRLRLSILGVVALSLFAALGARIWFLQVVGSPEYQLAAEVQRTREIQIEAPRGRIVDAKGRTMVDNRVVTVVKLERRVVEELPNREDALLRLAGELTAAGHPTKVDDLEDRLVDPRFSPIESVPVASDIDKELEIYLVERQEEFPGVLVERETVRTYPYGTIAAHVVGYVGRVTEDDLDEQMGPDRDRDVPKPYDENDTIGKTGVERIFEPDLRGTPGIKTVEVDVRGEILRTLEYEPPEPGNDVQLTIDLDVQAVAESELQRGINAARSQRNSDKTGLLDAEAGSAVVTDPQTGAVVALASWPTYAPDEFVGGITSQRYEELQTEGDPFTNRAISGQYAPGSTFKLITGYAGLSTGMIATNTSYNDRGVYEVSGCTGNTCIFEQPGGALGSLSIQRAITLSSDTFFYWLGDRFWRERETYGETAIQDAGAVFGLGKPTGVPLPFEQGGVLPTPEQRRERHELDPEAFPEDQWRLGDNINMSIGQGEVLVTPLQLANAYGTFANGGLLHNPNIASRILAPDSDPNDPNVEVVRQVDPRVVHDIQISPQNFSTMMAGFDGVTKSGTASSAFEGWDHSLWSVGGKTGTAQVRGKDDTSLFVGFGPVSSPQYVVAVIVEEGGFGAETAAPIVRRILEPLANVYPLPVAQSIQDRLSAPPPQDETDPGDLVAEPGPRD